MRIQPLRDRKEDISQLVTYFVQRFAKQMQEKIEAISPAVMKALMAWEWPKPGPLASNLFPLNRHH